MEAGCSGVVVKQGIMLTAPGMNMNTQASARVFQLYGNGAGIVLVQLGMLVD